jgi:hypothetical protein
MKHGAPGGGERNELARASIALVGCFVALLVVVLVLAGELSGTLSADAGRPVSRADLGEEWPLTVSNGLLRCEHGSEVTFQADGTSYTLNRSASHGAYSDIGPLLLDAGGGVTKDLGPLVERGLRLCK